MAAAQSSSIPPSNQEYGGGTSYLNVFYLLHSQWLMCLRFAPQTRYLRLSSILDTQVYGLASQEKMCLNQSHRRTTASYLQIQIGNVSSATNRYTLRYPTYQLRTLCPRMAPWRIGTPQQIYGSMRLPRA